MKPTTQQVLAKSYHPPYDDSMAPNILIRSVPGDVHQTLTRRASDSGQSLQEYLLEMLREVTSRPTMQEIVSWPEREGPGSRGLGATTQEIVEEIRAQRQR
jgi:antitoxin FitA